MDKHEACIEYPYEKKMLKNLKCSELLGFNKKRFKLKKKFSLKMILTSFRIGIGLEITLKH